MLAEVNIISFVKFIGFPLSGDWEGKWVQSKAKSDFGTFVTSTGKYFGDADVAKGTFILWVVC